MKTSKQLAADLKEIRQMRAALKVATKPEPKTEMLRRSTVKPAWILCS